jgi:hypothetical protein
MSDIKTNLVELSGPLGLNLTSEDTRIKHTKTGEFNISSNGTINIEPTVKLGVTTNKVDIISDNINITAQIFNISSKDATESSIEPNYINIIGGKGNEEFEGGSIYITGGDGLDGVNSSGGEIEIIGGQGKGTDGSGGQLRLASGSNGNGYGGDVYIEAGLSKYNPSGLTGGNINLQSGAGGFSCGDINLFVGPTYPGGSPTPGGPIGPSGRVNVRFGAFKLAIFANETERTTRIPLPEKGDMCLLEASTAGTNLIHYYNGSLWKAIQTI